MSSGIKNCRACGSVGPFEPLSGGLLRCPHCQQEFSSSLEDSNEMYSREIKEVIELRNSLKLDECELKIEELLKKYPLDNSDKKRKEINKRIQSDLYHQRFLCDYGVLYVDEKGNAISKPTLNRLSNKNCLENGNFQEAFDLASDKKQQEVLYDEANEIERIRASALELISSEVGYDIFISLKVRIPGSDGYTPDDKVAREIYNRLVSAGYRVFYSEETLKQKAGQDYEPIIYHALYTSPVFLLICTAKVEYINEQWVRNEWSRYLKRMEENSSLRMIPITKSNIKFETLPARINKMQGLEYDASFFENLEAILKSAVKRNVKSHIKQKEIEVAIKPKAVEVVEIKRTILGKSKEKVNIQLSEESALQSAKSHMDNMYESFRRSKKKKLAYKKSAFESLNKIIEKNEQNYHAYWNLYLLDNDVNNDANLQNAKCLSSFETLQNLLGKCFEYAPKEFVDEKLTTLTKQLEKNFDFYPTSSSFLYNFLLSYVSDKEMLNITSSYITSLTHNIYSVWKKNKKEFNFIKEFSKTVTKDVYPVLTKGGTNNVIDYYNKIASTLRRKRFFNLSVEFTNKAFELFEADPNALWNKLCCDFKIADEYELAKVLKNVELVKKTIEKLLSGGYSIDTSEGNYINRFLKICNDGIKTKSKESIELFKSILEILPNAKVYMDETEYNAYYTSINNEFVKRLLWAGKFSNAKFFANDLCKKELDDAHTHWLLLKAELKIKTNYGILSSKKDFSLSGTVYDNLVEKSSQVDDYNLVDRTSKLYNEIREDKKAKKVYLKLLEEIERLHIASFKDNKNENLRNLVYGAKVHENYFETDHFKQLEFPKIKPFIPDAVDALEEVINSNDYTKEKFFKVFDEHVDVPGLGDKIRGEEKIFKTFSYYLADNLQATKNAYEQSKTEKFNVGKLKIIKNDYLKYTPTNKKAKKVKVKNVRQFAKSERKSRGRWLKLSAINLDGVRKVFYAISFVLFSVSSPLFFSLLTVASVNVGLANQFINLFVVIPLATLTIALMESKKPLNCLLICAVALLNCFHPFLYLFISQGSQYYAPAVVFLSMLAYVPLTKKGIKEYGYFNLYSITNALMLAVFILHFTNVLSIGGDNYYSILYNFYNPGL